MKQKINLTAAAVTGRKIDSELEGCFGKAKYYFVADITSGEYEFVENPGLNLHESAGLKAAEYLIRMGVKTVISSNFGAAVKEIFDRYNVRIVMTSEKYKCLKDIKWVKKLKYSSGGKKTF